MRAVAIACVLFLAGCAAPAATDATPEGALAPLPEPIHEEGEVAAGAGIPGRGTCEAERPCFEVPFTLPRAALLRAELSWTSPANGMSLAVFSNGTRLFSVGADAGQSGLALARVIEAGDYLLRVSASRMAADRFVLDAAFSEAPAARDLPGCDFARAGIAHAAGAVPVTSGAAGPVPCGYAVPGETVEPTLGVDLASGQVFYYPVFGGPRPGYSVARSADEGATWELIAPNVQGEDTHRETADPYLYLDPATGRVFVDDLVGTCSVISWSDDLGASWDHTPVGGCMAVDHQTLFAGPPVSSATVGYPNVVYRCAATAVALSGASTMAVCQRSLDGGRSWLPHGEPAYTPRPTSRGQMGVQGYCNGLVAHGTTGADGVVYLPKGWCGEPWLAISRDEGLTWSRTLVADNGFLGGDQGGQGHDAGVGIDADGNVYYGWVAADRLPYVAVSRDGGASFEAPRMIAPPGVNEASHPELVAGGGGKFAFLYLGTTKSPGNFTSLDCTRDPMACVAGGTSSARYANTTWNAYVTVSLDALAASPTYWTVSLNDPADPLVRGACGEVRCGAGHDFFDIRLGPDGSAWVALGDSCVDACVDDPSAPGGNQALVGRVLGFDLRS